MDYSRLNSVLITNKQAVKRARATRQASEITRLSAERTRQETVLLQEKLNELCKRKKSDSGR